MLTATELNTVLRIALACSSNPELLDDVERLRRMTGALTFRQTEMLNEIRRVAKTLINKPPRFRSIAEMSQQSGKHELEGERLSR
ncbi:MAG: hypothetical protein U1E62_11925 [Alsobacter sp.]